VIRRALLTENDYSRPGFKLRRVEAIVLHWYGNPATTARFTWHYFDTLRSHRASAHYLIDDMEIVQAVPDDEVAYGCGPPYTEWATARWGGEHPNWYVIHVEHSHPDWSGVWTRPVQQRSHVLVAGLCLAYDLDPHTAILRHYDVTGKDCPRWYVNDHEAWARYRDTVAGILEA